MFCIIWSFLINNVSSVYDHSINIFNPRGQLVQVDYAEIASSKGAPLLGIILGECIILITRSQNIDNLLDTRSVDKFVPIDDNIWASFTGLGGDGKALIRRSRKLALNFKEQFDSQPSVLSIARRIGDLQHEATVSGGMIKLLFKMKLIYDRVDFVLR
jgi:proteasome alpha subunit